ncbi:hypothetical protein DCAR_0104075 [Daucus carota subsp. sativus]|uniref:TF-B3 domain-containing protein n=1 Tax=Daucus carota subsp. sativus TaxID=79200 RepID=A0AAF0W7U1_DAUCS|nr:hypothetical protein DCAR_0104075 [Daucus carota subsp. sativus]
MDPSFFKPLVGDFSRKLLIPPAFVERMEGKLGSELALKYECERVYTVQVEKLEEGRFFFVNGWPQFVADHGLDYGDFVVFRLVQDSTFQVTVYDPSMCEKDCCDSHRNKNGDRTAGKVIKEEARTSLDQNTSLDSLSRPPPPPPLWLSPLSLSLALSLSLSHSLWLSLSAFLTKCFTIRVLEWILQRMTKKLMQRWRSMMNQKRPLQMMMLHHFDFFPLPLLFVRESGLADKEQIKLRDPDGKKWLVKVINEGKKAALTVGWTRLFVAHRLKRGDTCIFTYVRREGSSGIIQVDMKRGRGRPPKKESS